MEDNFITENVRGDKNPEQKTPTNYPSRFAVGETVDLDFNNSKYLKSCTVEAVLFTESKVFYDIRVPFGFQHSTVLREVDSVVVVDPVE